MMKFLFFFSLFCIVNIGIQAQNSNNELLKKLVEKQFLTQTEADEIKQDSKPKTEEKSSLAGQVQKVREAFNTPYMRFGGFGLLTYRFNEFSKSHHDIRPRLVFVSVTGKLTNTISYGILFEFANPTLHEFFGEWTPSKYFNLKGGQFKVPLTLENPISPANLETIYNTRSISSLTGMADDVLRLGNKANGPGRDIGIQVSGSAINNGSYDLIQYWAGMFQGSGINISDPNNSKDFSGMLLIQPIKGFRIGGGAYFGEATYKNEHEESASDHVRNRWVISTDYNTDRFSARAEWLHGKDGLTNKEGLYGTATYYLSPKKVNVAAKVDYFNKNKDTNSEVMDYTLAVNYYFFPQCRLQLNYTYSDYSKRWEARNTHMVAGQMQIVF